MYICNLLYTMTCIVYKHHNVCRSALDGKDFVTSQAYGLTSANCWDMKKLQDSLNVNHQG